MKNRVLPEIGLVVLIVCLSVATIASAKPEKKVMRFYNRHIEEMKASVHHHFEKGEPLSGPDGVTVQEWPGEHPIVEYLIMAGGMVSSSRYYGVFYSCDNTPVSFQNSGEKLVAVSDTEWKWQGGGDNHGSVRQIEQNWFYFEAAF